MSNFIPLATGVAVTTAAVSTVAATSMTIDWTQVLIAFIAGLPVLLTAVVSLVLTMRVKAEQLELKAHVNSKMDLLIEETKKVSNLEGKESGRTQGLAEAAVTAEATKVAIEKKGV